MILKKLNSKAKPLKNKEILLKNDKQNLKYKQDVKEEAHKKSFVYFRRSKRNIIISVCDSQNHVKAVLSIGHLKVNKIKLKVRARKATYNLKKLSYMLGSLVYKQGFTHLCLKFKNDFPKKVEHIFLNTLKLNKKFKIIKMVHSVSKPHNGCRKPKIRRK